MRRSILFVVTLLTLAAPVCAQTITQDLATARGRYGATVTRAQAAAVLNEAAWKHRAEGWGLLAKPGGNRCPQPTTSIDVSCDWLVNKATGKGADVLSSATNDDGSPAPGHVGTVNATEAFDVGRFIAPVDPGTPDTGGSPGGGTTGGTIDDAALKALTARVQRLEEQNAAVLARLTDLHGAVWNEVQAALNDLRLNADDHVRQLIAQAFAHVVAQGSTGRTLGHSHSINLTLRPVQ